MIRSRISGLLPEVRHVAGLHFGWWTDDRIPLDVPAGGKALRPALALLACQAVGGCVEAACPPAVAVELVHNASLLHDDIIDHDPLRRGRPALWSFKGLPAALLAGDALFFAAVQTLAEAPRPDKSILILLASVQVLIEGEYLDTLVDAGTGTSEDRALAVAAAKTGELMGCACHLGALAAGAAPERARHLRNFGQRLGTAFQCADDLLGIWGDEQHTGKPVWSDLRERKVTAPVAAAMAGHTSQARALRALYQQGGTLSEDDCRRAAKLIEETGAKEATLRRARRHVADALEHLSLARPEATTASELAALASLVTDRDR
ncbi:polyprenyl synthetase family protein [Streptomyces alanosinicus]|uniref:Dimethylallyltransferase n=1 Tax=Streptomyces alanosinicus TaxID=68171 RepID=A0A918YRF5_9ACTN|nr:polyprenyl synthetase family protein [Streptomyces alanosinicus]GHE11009.1 dimethylallyltransferase [Streptomyces alanosinicus]